MKDGTGIILYKRYLIDSLYLNRNNNKGMLS